MFDVAARPVRAGSLSSAGGFVPMCWMKRSYRRLVTILQQQMLLWKVAAVICFLLGPAYQKGLERGLTLLSSTET